MNERNAAPQITKIAHGAPGKARQGNKHPANRTSTCARTDPGSGSGQANALEHARGQSKFMVEYWG